jgi:hypothetical protein
MAGSIASFGLAKKVCFSLILLVVVVVVQMGCDGQHLHCAFFSSRASWAARACMRTLRVAYLLTHRPNGWLTDWLADVTIDRPTNQSTRPIGRPADWLTHVLYRPQKNQKKVKAAKEGKSKKPSKPQTQAQASSAPAASAAAAAAPKAVAAKAAAPKATPSAAPTAPPIVVASAAADAATTSAPTPTAEAVAPAAAAPVTSPNDAPNDEVPAADKAVADAAEQEKKVVQEATTEQAAAAAAEQAAAAAAEEQAATAAAEEAAATEKVASEQATADAAAATADVSAEAETEETDDVAGLKCATCGETKVWHAQLRVALSLSRRCLGALLHSHSPISFAVQMPLSAASIRALARSPATIPRSSSQHSTQPHSHTACLPLPIAARAWRQIVIVLILFQIRF